ncbi:hypothetical protein BDZ97DRAFT_626298 [Flammula alnicola]|nr:hypothetical protein BDZ97DRAFT_626298 [Flammula alnicola]
MNLLSPMPLRPWEGIAPEITENTFFQIDEYVILRKFSASTGTYSRWAVGKVVRPLIRENNNGTEERYYMVTYSTNPKTGEFKDQKCSLALDEIRAIPFDDSKSITPFNSLTAKVLIGTEASKEPLKPNVFLFAAVPIQKKSKSAHRDTIPAEIWAPAMYIETTTNNGYSVHVVGGQFKDQRFIVYKVKPYGVRLPLQPYEGVIPAEFVSV